ncbi:serine hydrolase domain-containing protein [Xanthocytophaga agilis]|uniref:Serine hydrolase domain-containing protein n=1 Tax=Xanthocytophaga agilis TaxID=3048010 RepID=A0AAE3R5D1_9BACT|nr:serine hydrolase domain-containing protein [Xanthocytophaga agilis]MDJ1501739.1 serine hydrolase domain-containing protein [Xanthocytophaga agilis]
MLKRLTLFGIICVLISLSCSTAKRPAKNESSAFGEIETFLQSLIDTGGIPGITIAITNGSDIVYSKAFGVTNIETKEKLEPKHIFHIASVSKTFVATAVMQLYEKGKLDVNQPLITYLPYFKLNDERYKNITIRQMLNHTSGLPDVEDYEWEKATSDEGAAERYTRSLTDSKLISAPGAEFHYSNMAFDIMADLIAKVSGMSFEKYVKENILLPLEMNESSFYAPEIQKDLRTSPHIGHPPKVSSVYPYNRMHAPSSTLNTNVLEMSHWAIANMNNGRYKSTQILSPATHAMMLTPTFVSNKERKVSIGLSWFMYSYQGLMNYEHGGGDLGYRSMLTLIPEKKIGIIILCNSEEIHMYDTRNKVRDILLASSGKTTSH